MSDRKPRRVYCEASPPFIEIKGDAADCGYMLGETWRAELRQRAERPREGKLSFLGDSRVRALLEDRSPCLIELIQGMAKGAGLDEKRILTIDKSPIAGEEEGCTSFALRPSATLDGIPISGQTKDTAVNRMFHYQILALSVKDGFELLTMTYPGWLFGHGFSPGGCAVFRNSLSCGDSGGWLPYDLWGLLTHLCPTIDAVRELTMKHGVAHGFHCAVADENGGVLGVEAGRSGVAFLEPDAQNVYVHANHCASDGALREDEDDPIYGMEPSRHRERRLYELLRKDVGYLTPQLIYAAMTDHDHYPDSVCSDARHGGHVTSAAVIAEPTRRLLHVVRGLPSQNWPRTYCLP